MTEAEFGVIDAYMRLPGMATGGQHAFLMMGYFLINGHESQTVLDVHNYYKENNPQ